MAGGTVFRQWAGALAALPVTAARPWRAAGPFPDAAHWLAGATGVVAAGTPLCGPLPGGPALEAGPGVEFDGAGRAIAAVDGRAVARRSATGLVVAVLPQRTHPGDWGPGAGWAAWTGDLKVLGQVSGPGTLTADGQVHISGGVYGATVVAAGGIRVGGTCCEAEIRRGGPAAAAPRLGPLARRLSAGLRRLEAAAAQVPGPLNWSAPGPAVALLASRRFHQVAEDLDQLPEMLAALPSDAAAGLWDLWRALCDALAGGRLAELDQLGRWAAELEQGALALAQPEHWPAPGPVQLHGLIRTEVTAEGDLEIAGPGAEQCAIRATGRVTVHGTLRGGWLEAGGDVRLGEAAGTAVLVPAGAVITARRIQPWTVLAVGGAAHRFESPARNVRVWLENGGSLAVGGAGWPGTLRCYPA